VAPFIGRNILITGASSGIGAALAVRLANQGANLVLAARRTDRLEKLVKKIGDGHAAFAHCDVARREDLDQAVATMREKFGPVDIAIANAGYCVSGKFEDLSVDDYQRQFNTNVLGVLQTVYAVLDDLKATRGQLVIVGSINGYMAFPGASAYAMSKFAIRALCDSLTHELRPYGITVTHVAPGFVQSEIRQVDNFGVYQPDQYVGSRNALALSANRAARLIIKAVARRKRGVVISGHGKVAVWIARHAPWLFDCALRVRAWLKLRNRPVEVDEESEEIASV